MIKFKNETKYSVYSLATTFRHVFIDEVCLGRWWNPFRSSHINEAKRIMTKDVEEANDKVLWISLDYDKEIPTEKLQDITAPKLEKCLRKLAKL